VETVICHHCYAVRASYIEFTLLASLLILYRSFLGATVKPSS
jgi:hypothetical protein